MIDQKDTSGQKLAHENLCYYDSRNPNSLVPYLDPEDRPQPGTEGCPCDNCFYGRHELAEEIIRLWNRRSL